MRSQNEKTRQQTEDMAEQKEDSVTVIICTVNTELSLIHRNDLTKYIHYLSPSFYTTAAAATTTTAAAATTAAPPTTTKELYQQQQKHLQLQELFLNPRRTMPSP